MAFVFYNLNPDDLRVGDCVVRAISKVEGMDWYDTYIEITSQGMEMSDMPDSNRVWMAYLKDIGYKITLLPNDYDTWDSGAEIPIYYFVKESD